VKTFIAVAASFSLVACSQSGLSTVSGGSSQQTGLSTQEVETVVAPTPSQEGSGGGGGSSSAKSSTQETSPAPQQAAATTQGKSSSDNTKRSLTWLFGTVGVIAGVLVTTDLITGELGIFGTKKSSTDKEAEAQPAQQQSTSSDSAGSQHEVQSPTSTPQPDSSCADPSATSSSIKEAKNIVQQAGQKTP